MSGADERATSRVTAQRAITWVGLVVVVGVGLGLTGCGSSPEAGPRTAGDVSATVAIGDLPDELTGRTAPPPPPTTTPPSSAPATVPPEQQLTGPVGELVLGNRIIVIGDSVMASTAPRNDGAMCEALNGFGWDVEINTEPGRFVEFGHAVLDQRFRPEGGDDWDVAAIMLGNQFAGDLASFESELDDLLARLAPRPVILYTITETDVDRAAINDVIRDQPRYHPNLVIIDWAEITLNDAETLLVDDGPALTDVGSDRLVLYTAGALQQAPGEPPGECLPTIFTDDTAIVL